MTHMQELPNSLIAAILSAFWIAERRNQAPAGGRSESRMTGIPSAEFTSVVRPMVWNECRGVTTYIKRWKQAKQTRRPKRECGCGATIYALNAVSSPPKFANGPNRKDRAGKSTELRCDGTMATGKIAEASVRVCQEIPAVTTALRTAHHGWPRLTHAPGRTHDLRHSRDTSWLRPRITVPLQRLRQHVLGPWEPKRSSSPQRIHIHRVNGVKDRQPR